MEAHNLQRQHVKAAAMLSFRDLSTVLNLHLQAGTVEGHRGSIYAPFRCRKCRKCNLFDLTVWTIVLLIISSLCRDFCLSKSSPLAFAA